MRSDTVKIKRQVVPSIFNLQSNLGPNLPIIYLGINQSVSVPAVWSTLVKYWLLITKS